jgi:hypothetical protein
MMKSSEEDVEPHHGTNRRKRGTAGPKFGPDLADPCNTNPEFLRSAIMDDMKQ